MRARPRDGAVHGNPVRCCGPGGVLWFAVPARTCGHEPCYQRLSPLNLVQEDDWGRTEALRNAGGTAMKALGGKAGRHRVGPGCLPGRQLARARYQPALRPYSCPASTSLPLGSCHSSVAPRCNAAYTASPLFFTCRR